MANWDPQANELFLKALDLPAADQRHRFLDEACAGDADLRARVDGLLQAGAQAGSFLEAPACALGETIDEVLERPGTVIGPYKLLQELGEGGFGMVYLADQRQPVRRQ